MKVDTTLILHEAGLKVTKQRVAILKILACAKSHLSAEDLLLQLSRGNARYSLATIYRTLAVFAQNNIVQRVKLQGDDLNAYYVFSAQTVSACGHGAPHRHHLVCIGCKKNIAIDTCPVDAFSAQMARQCGFILKGHSFEIYGLCRQCQVKQDKHR